MKIPDPRKQNPDQTLNYLNTEVKLKKSNKTKNEDDLSGEEDSDGDDDDGNYVNMVRTALKDTRNIIGEITPGGTLWE
jgi:hypothetical protein